MLAELICVDVGIQWNPSKMDTIGTKDFVCCSEVSLAQGLVIDHTPRPIILVIKQDYGL